MRLGFVLALPVMAACDGAGTCVEVSSACTPEYPPSYDAVYANTIATSCQLGGCHGGGSDAGGLALGESAAEAYEALRVDRWVIEGDAACSPMFVAIASGRMPPGDDLSAAEQCAVQQWIDEGASP